jgi:prepilin signal peptidase PulO-like enzyme (type II secretory pathway)
MLGLIGRMVGFGLLGMIVTPILVVIIVLTLAYQFDPRCGTPGDSGGCEMGAASLGFVSALPGLAIGVAFALYRHFRKKRATPVGKP